MTNSPMGVMGGYCITQKSADLMLFTYARGLSITQQSNKQQETYADMTNRLAKIRQSRCNVTPIGIY